MVTPLVSLVIFHIILVVAFFVDLYWRRSASLQSALRWSAFWVLHALLFAGYVGVTRGISDATTFTAAYVLEKSLSLDNIFVFWMIFQRWNIPSQCQHRVLMWGVVGAIVMRIIMITLGMHAVRTWHSALWFFGLFLILTGLYTLVTAHKPRTVTQTLPPKWVSSNTQYFWFDGKPTILLMALLCVEWSDVVFAIDSVPAIFGLTQDVLIIYTSNIMAILGLRSLYDVLQYGADRVKYLPYGIGAILCIVGLKMLGLVVLSPLQAIVLTLTIVGACLWKKTPSLS